MLQPQMLFNTQYPLSKKDFTPNQFHQILFISIAQIAQSGGNEISEIEIENFIKNYPDKLEVLQDNNFFDFISTVKELCTLSNYELYYTEIRKFSLLRDLKEQGFDIKDYFDELQDEDGQRAKLSKWTIQEILNDVEIKSIKLRNKYDVKYIRDEMKAGENTKELLAKFREKPKFGACLQSPYLTTLFQGWCRGHFLMRSAPSETGKAIPNDTIIPTPNGFKRVGEIKVGDYLYDREGKPTKVTAVFPQGEKEVWEITFKDGRKAKCCEEHLWSYYYKGKTKNKHEVKVATKTLKEIMQKPLQNNDKSWRYAVPVNSPIEKEAKNYYIPPYVLGLFLGDGSFRVNNTNKTFFYSALDEELPRKIAKIMGWEYSKNSVNNCSWSFKKDQKNIHVEDIFKEHPNLIGVYSKDKYIPEEYMNGSIEQRIDLICGLLDTDGTVTTCGSISFCSTSKKLCKQVVELCRSLGMSPTLSSDKRVYKYTSGYCGTVTLNCPIYLQTQIISYSPKVKLLRKALTKKKKIGYNKNPIINIQNLHYKTPMTCFIVDNPEHLFLMNDYIVTHNSRFAVGDLCTVGAKYWWNEEAQDFIENPNYQGSTFFIHTEMDTEDDINTMFLACVSGVEYRSIRNPDRLTKEEEQRVEKAGLILLDSNIRLISMPDFTNASIERKVKELVENEGVTYGVFDYLEIQGALSAEYKNLTNMPVREDLVLKNSTAVLKNIAETYNIGLLSMSQLNDNWKTMAFPDNSCLSGGKSMMNKLDGGSIIIKTKERPKEIKLIEPYLHRKGFGANSLEMPNTIEYIYKARFNPNDNDKIKIYSYFDRGTFRRTDFFCTDTNDQILPVEKTIIQNF